MTRFLLAASAVLAIAFTPVAHASICEDLCDFRNPCDIVQCHRCFVTPDYIICT